MTWTIIEKNKKIKKGEKKCTEKMRVNARKSKIRS